MSRTLKLMAYAAILEMALVALAVFGWRHGMFSGLPAPGPNTHPQPLVTFLPPWLAIAMVYAGRRLASDRPRISGSHRGYLEGSLKASLAFAVALQGLYAYIDVTGAIMDRPLLLRAIGAFVGLWLVIQGNAAAKLDPPSGAGAPAPGTWTRTVLRFGWIMVASGLAIVVCAVGLPLALLAPVMIAVAAIGVAGELAYRRLTRPGQPA